jgi:hypothetical protein
MKYKRKDITKWHSWFAWKPIDVNGYTVWLEMVQRKGRPVFDDYVFEYKLAEEMTWDPGEWNPGDEGTH